jgi:large subunit ribosomal protein L18
MALWMRRLRVFGRVFGRSDVRTFGRSDARVGRRAGVVASARRRATDARARRTAPRDRSAMSRAMRGAVRDALRRSLAEKAPHSLRVHVSNKYVYAQIVRALDGHVVASASTIERAFPFAESDASASATTRETRSRSDKRAAAAVGDALARRAKAANVDAVKWTRPYGKRFHGKIASLMEALKSGGVGLL